MQRALVVAFIRQRPLIFVHQALPPLEILIFAFRGRLLPERRGELLVATKVMQLVPSAGVEPARLFRQGILSPQRLPFRHEGEHTPESYTRGALVNGLCGFLRKTNLAAALLPYHVRRVKIGFLGGSFDPIHFGHLIAAQDACEQQKLDRIFLVPAAQAPLKPNGVQSSAEDRLAMVRVAVEWDHRFEVSDFELRRGGVSFTIDSARHFRTLFPHDQLYWIIGGDQLPKLHLWKDVEELASLLEFIFLERPGHPIKPVQAIPGLRLHRCDGHLVEISSTELRDRVRKDLSLDYFVPHKTILHINEKRLYC